MKDFLTTTQTDPPQIPLPYYLLMLLAMVVLSYLSWRWYKNNIWRWTFLTIQAIQLFALYTWYLWHPRTTDNSKTKKDDISDDSHDLLRLNLGKEQAKG